MSEEIVESTGPKKSIADWLRIVQRRRWLIVLPAFVVWALVWGVTWFLPKSYRSETMILVDAPRIPDQYIVPNVNDIQDRLQGIKQQIVSRKRMVDIVKEFNLYPEMRKYGTEDDFVARLRKDIEVELVQNPGNPQDLSGFKLSYTAPDPKLAQQVTAKLSSQFIDENVNLREQQSVNTTEFLESQLGAARKTLSEQEGRVREFKKSYMGQLPTQLQPNLQILQGLQSRLDGELEALNRAKQQNLYLESLMGQYRTIQSELRRTGTTGETPAQIDRDLTRMRAELADLTGRYTEAHPDVKKLKQQIAATEKIKRQLDAQAAAQQNPSNDVRATTMGELDSATPMIQVESQLRANKLEIDQRQKEVQRISNEIAGYQGRINQAPLREQQLADITRDYEQTRKDYESLLAKKNQSELATNLVQRQQNDQFRMVDPPTLPTKPFAPNRLKLCFMGLAGGLALGVGTSLLLEVMGDRVENESEITAVIPVGVIGHIPSLETDEEKDRWKKQLRFELAGAACIALMVLVGFAITYVKG